MGLPTSSLPDEELAVALAQGDQAAEATLYQKYSDRVFYLALSERHSREDAEDIRAETFLRVIRALRDGKLRNPDSLPSFIVGIALNVMREHNRRHGRTDSLTNDQNAIAGGESPETAFLNQELSSSVADLVAQLKPRDREFLRLYYYEELPKEEIAQKLGIKEERLRLIKSRALKKFREIYARFTRE